MPLSPLMAAVLAHDDLARSWYRQAMLEHGRLSAHDAVAITPRSLFVWGWSAGSEEPVLTARLRPIALRGGDIAEAMTVAARLLLVAGGCTTAILSTSLFSASTDLDGDRPWTRPRLIHELGNYPNTPAGVALWTYGINLAGDMHRMGTWMTPAGAYDVNREARYALDQELIRDGLIGAGLAPPRPINADLASVFPEPLTFPQQRAVDLLATAMLLDVRFQGQTTTRAPRWVGGEPPTREWMQSTIARVRPKLAEIVDRYM